MSTKNLSSYHPELNSESSSSCHSERSRGIPLNQIIGDDTQRNSKIYLSSLGKYLKSKSASERDTSTPLSLRSVGQKFGFTLVELIVVITILVILGTIGFTSMQGFSSSARDSSRVSDLTNLQESLHLSYIKTGYYPTPSNFFGVTYSGATVWNQGTIGDSVITHLSSNGTKLSKKPTDSFYPNIEYTYSLLNTGKEFQIASIYEGTSIAFLPFGLPTAQATSQTYVTQIKGNYNGAVAKVSTGNTVYVLAVPSIILADTGTLDLNTLSATSSSNWVLNNKSNLPFSYKGADISLTGSVFSFAPTQPPAGSGLVVYANASLPTDNTGALALINALRSSYSGTTVQTEPSIKILFNSTLTQTELANLGKSLITTSLGGAAIALTQNTQTNTGSTGGSSSAPYIDDVFSTYLYTGNGGTQTINNGIDLAEKGGMVWTKGRNNNSAGNIYDTVRGKTKRIQSNSAAGDLLDSSNEHLITFGVNGFTLGGSENSNYQTSTNGVSWTFRKAPKFFTENTFTHTGGIADTIDLSTLGTVGMVVVKRTDNTSDWYTWHKDLTTGNNLKLNLTDAQSTTNAYISASGTNMTFSASAPIGTYVYYAWANDTGSDGIVEAGSYVISGNTDIPVNLGFEPQFLLVKSSSVSNTNWTIRDSQRGWTYDNGANFFLPNTSDVETQNQMVLRPTPTGFIANGASHPANGTYIYLAIRRPNKPPTSGTEVYNTTTQPAGGGSPLLNVGFPTDLSIQSNREMGGAAMAWDRLRGSNRLFTYNTNSENLYPYVHFDKQNYISQDWSGNNVIMWNFRRTPGVFDMVAYTGDGANPRALEHSLGVPVEFGFIKARTNSAMCNSWTVKVSSGANVGRTSGSFNLDTTFGWTGWATDWSDPSSTSSVFYVNNSGNGASTNNTSGTTYIAYLFATKANISKVGSYAGSASNVTIDCGFTTTPPRFLMIKRTDSTGDWFVWDSTRGFDKRLSLNTTAAEVTGDSSITTNNAGFVANTGGVANGGTSATYIYLCIH